MRSLATIYGSARLSGLEIIAKLATVLEVEPAELLRVSVPKDDLGRDKLNR
jgi:hypothetical protein